MNHSFHIGVLTLPGFGDSSVAIAANRGGATAIVNLEYCKGYATAMDAMRRLDHHVESRFGVKLGSTAGDFFAELGSDFPDHLGLVILSSYDTGRLEERVRMLHEKKINVLWEATSIEEAQFGERAGVDGIIAKGHETAGRIGEETAFVLLQRFLKQCPLPIRVYGGVGLHTIAACAAAGAAGVIVDSQLALTKESPLNESIKARIASMDGSETVCLGGGLGEVYRVYFRPGCRAVDELRQIEQTLVGATQPKAATLDEWRQAIAQRVGWESAEQNVLLLGEDAAFASDLAGRFRTVGGVVRGLLEVIRKDCRIARKLKPLDEGSPLARSVGIRYPILQGPMTRVSDKAEFAAKVAEGGALPFLALALMRGSEIRPLLDKAHRLCKKQPWGVGILGFVPAALREEQLDAILLARPPFALIAGGRPDQSRSLEEAGISTFLHVPSPGLLRMFLDAGARRFVFEGRECGGHVGPRTSFVLWNQIIDVLLGFLAANETRPDEYHIVFAGGIHDAFSASMVSVMAAPLAEKGVRIGVLMGSAYLFTEDAVDSGAIVKGFQDQALACNHTVLLETGPGHSTRCADTPFAEQFEKKKRRLITGGSSADEVRESLEELNLGRLRMASKGVARNSEFRQDPQALKLTTVSESEQTEQGMYMIGQVAALRNQTCSVEALHREVAVGGSERLEALAEDNLVRPAVSSAQSNVSDIAIIGMATLLPKAPNLQRYWENILNKVDAITEVPKDRWDPEQYFDPDPGAKDKVYSKWGGFLDDIPFDPMKYGMPPSSLRSIDPGQLLTLEVVHAALDDAGYQDRSFARERTSVILGAGGGAADLGLGYGARTFLTKLDALSEGTPSVQAVLARAREDLPEWTEDSFAGILTNVLSGRVANRFDFGGTNFTVDAACASSLAAVSQGMKELQGGTSEMVIVGGVDTMQNPFTYLCFSKTHALSPRGRCRTFDASADGIVISEGIAILVLKRLDDAERDGDRIYAVLKGVGSSSDGRDKGLTAPRPEGQARALERAYAQADVPPSTIGLIEAHGTGTVAGDQAEVQALSGFFSEAHAARQRCALGSVKSMIGHTKCTAGVAGLVKASLALHHKVLPPTLGVEKPNMNVQFAEMPLYVNTESRPWINSADSSPRRAGVSAFGFGGTNFHVVLEEYANDLGAPAAVFQEWPSELFLWQADSREALWKAIEPWEHVLTGDDLALSDLAFTAWKQLNDTSHSDRQEGQIRLAIVADSANDLAKKLARTREALRDPENRRIAEPSGVYYSEQPLAADGKVAFLFPGQGSQYVDMLRDIAIYFPEVRSCFERADKALAGKFAIPLSDFVFPTPGFSPEELSVHRQALTETNVAQPAIGVASLAMHRLLEILGVVPDMVAGHSYGEFTALAAAGALSEDALIALSEARGRFMAEAAGEGRSGMVAVQAGAKEVQNCIEDIDGVSIANLNAPKQTVISGGKNALEQAVERLASSNVSTQYLPVACAFHSAIVAPAQERLAAFLSEVRVDNPQVPVYSNITASAYPDDARGIKEQLSIHLVRPVAFIQEIEALYLAGARIFVEVGPRNILTKLVGKILGDRSQMAVASDQIGRDGVGQLLHLLGCLAVESVPVNLDRIFQGRSAKALNLRNTASQGEATKLPPTTWLVNGARAKPLSESSSAQCGLETPAKDRSICPAAFSEPPAPKARDIPLQQPVSNGREASVSRIQSASDRNEASLPRLPTAKASPIAASPQPVADLPQVGHAHGLSAVPPAAGGEVSEVMAQYQRMMTRFLEAQQSVMLSYLQGPAAMTSIEPSVQTEASYGLPVAGHEPSQGEGLSSAPEASAAEPLNEAPIIPGDGRSAPEPTSAVVEEAAQQFDSGELTEQLLAIVSERTGYPPEMLDLDLDLEADLGVDSIKWVEILGTFQQSLGASAQQHGEEMMEKLAGIRTLRGIVDWVAERMGSDGVDQSPSPAVLEDAKTPPSTKRLDREELTAKLLEIVSERTGYPPEMLDLDVDLEADLGVDSIKRVEILGTFQQSLGASAQQHGEEMMEKLAGIRTLRGIVDWVAERSLSGSDTESPQTADTGKRSESPLAAAIGPDDSEQDLRIQRYTLALKESPLSKQPQVLAKDRLILVTEDGRGIAASLADVLQHHGFRTTLVRHAAGNAEQACEGDAVSADLSSPDAVIELLDRLRQKEGPLGGIIHLLPLSESDAFEQLDGERWKERLRIETKSLFYLAKGAARDLTQAAENGGAWMMAVTGMGGGFAVGDIPGSRGHLPSQGGIAGLIKTLAHEWPGVRTKAIDVNLRDPEETLVNHLFDEFMAGDNQVEVGYDGSRRLTIQPELAPLNQKQKRGASMDSSWVILITGGARGVTAEVAKELAERYQPTLLLVGRSPLPDPQESPITEGLTAPKELKAALIEQMRKGGQTVKPAEVEQVYTRLLRNREMRRNLAAMQASGAKVHYYETDVRDMETFGRLIEKLYASFGRIDGAIHGAGVIEDKLIEAKTPESFDRVFDTKVDSAFVLSRKLKPEALKFLVFFSSVAGRFGNRGQGDYAAANEVLNKIAADLQRRWPGRVVSIDWGPWATAGMVSPELKKQFAERGVELIPMELGRRKLNDELSHGHKGESGVIIGGAGWRGASDEPSVAETAARPWKLPLIGKAPFSSSGPGGLVEVVRKLDPSADLYLRDHQLDGEPVFPLVMAMELVAEVVAHGWPALEVSAIRDFRVLHGLRLSSGAETVRVVAQPETMTGRAPFDVSVEIVGSENRNRIYYRGMVRVEANLPTPPIVESLPVAQLCSLSMGVKEAYENWLFHGPLFQGINRIEQFGSDGIKATLSTSSPDGWLKGGAEGGWLIDPLMIDSGLQLLLIWSREHWDITTLPSCFKSYRRFANPSSQDVRCEVRIRPETGGHAIHADLVFRDSAGALLGIFEDFEGTCSKALNRLAGKASSGMGVAG